ncbi:PTS sugar transporter subunit IIB [Companilactobacillus ginsenosidimutans]|uniref:PTS lactose transporter subunit IIB n=1 Tax=Companilactobacillus ginsenosidimutans TaxID=1007676 RepID=A0A0H4QGA5_9LACO|nr:PTS sugar transporter subunit IIB [Companilactobacillus ginsenosidimutans]AKP67434.1 PTS lactose transporter subunit IIB [Companilactobacillus ginsenosidimutans]
MTKKVLLTCGAGASSGFMAAAGRKAVKQMEADLNISAKSEAEVENYLPDIDLLLVAPHLKYKLEEVEEIAQANNVKCAVIPQQIYGMLDGKGLVNLALKELGE